MRYPDIHLSQYVRIRGQSDSPMYRVVAKLKDRRSIELAPTEPGAHQEWEARYLEPVLVRCGHCGHESDDLAITLPSRCAHCNQPLRVCRNCDRYRHGACTCPNAHATPDDQPTPCAHFMPRPVYRQLLLNLPA